MTFRQVSPNFFALLFLFNPLNIAFAVGVLPDTGQTKCYNNTGEIPCPAQGQTFYGQDGNYQGPQPAYQLSNDNLIVTDLNTGLMWQKSDGTGRNWSSAINYCANLVLGGYSDWRLPNRLELISIVDYGRRDPSINPVFSSRGRYYWSYSTTANSPNHAWSLNLYSGYMFVENKTVSDYVRCVRGGSLNLGPYVNNSDGTVTDSSTGLLWQQVDDEATKTWQEAISYCEALNLAGKTNWRLPNIRELQSIVDYGRIEPAINPVFSCQVLKPYWSSTTDPDYTLNRHWAAWYADFNFSGMYASIKNDNSYYVRCVSDPTIPSNYGIFIGNNFFGNDLKGGLVAKDIYDSFSSLNNVAYRKLITDEGFNFINQGRIKKEIDKIKEVIRPKDTLFIFISGHGGNWPSGDETTDTPGDEFVSLSEKRNYFGPFLLTDDELYEMLNGLDDVQKWVLIDACFGGGFWGDNNPADEGDLEKLFATSLLAAANEIGYGRVLISAGLPETEDPYRNSPDFRKTLFGIAVREALTRKEDGKVRADIDNDGILTFDELSSWVKNDAKVYLPEGLGFHLDGVFLATNDFGESTAFSWDEWNPESRKTEDFNGAIFNKPLNSIIAKSNGPYSGYIGEAISLDASGSSSPNGNIVLYEWDINNDGIYDISTNSSTVIQTYSSPYDGVIMLRVTDNQNFVDHDSASMLVSSSLFGDFDNDCDVDGSDLAVSIANTSLIDLSMFSQKFGENVCE